MTELIMWITCSCIQIITCLLLMYAEDNKEKYKEVFCWLIIGFTPMSMFIVIGVIMLLLITGIMALFDYIAGKLFDAIK